MNERLDRQLHEAEAQIDAARTQAMGALRGIATETAEAVIARVTGRRPITAGCRWLSAACWRNAGWQGFRNKHHAAKSGILVLVSFIIFFALFGMRLWGMMTGMLDGRAAAIRAELDQASQTARRG